jgi:hypothetical protein
MKFRRLKIYSIFYGLIVVAFCVYWATNFTKHTTYKGDEFFMLVQFLLALTYVFYFAIQFWVKRINFLFALSIPILSCIASFCIGIFILFATRVSDIPKGYIMIYGLTHGFISLVAVYRYWGRSAKTIF